MGMLGLGGGGGQQEPGLLGKTWDAGVDGLNAASKHVMPTNASFFSSNMSPQTSLVEQVRNQVEGGLKSGVNSAIDKLKKGLFGEESFGDSGIGEKVKDGAFNKIKDVFTFGKA